MGRARNHISGGLLCPWAQGRTIIRFWRVKPLSFKGWKSLGGCEPSGWGSEAVPAGGCCAGV